MSDHDHTPTFQESWDPHGDPVLAHRRYDCPSCGPNASARSYRCTSCGTDLATGSGRVSTSDDDSSDYGDGADGVIIDVDVGDDSETGENDSGVSDEIEIADDECAVECPQCHYPTVITRNRWLEGGTLDCAECDGSITIAEVTVHAE
jgi:ribosomal protein L37AE/L43A